MQYLYAEGDLYTFMDNTTYDQFQMAEDLLDDALKYISEGDSVEALFYEEKPVLVELPPSVVSHHRTDGDRSTR